MHVPEAQPYQPMHTHSTAMHAHAANITDVTHTHTLSTATHAPPQLYIYTYVCAHTNTFQQKPCRKLAGRKGTRDGGWIPSQSERTGRVFFIWGVERATDRSCGFSCCPRACAPVSQRYLELCLLGPLRLGVGGVWAEGL